MNLTFAPAPGSAYDREMIDLMTAAEAAAAADPTVTVDQLAAHLLPPLRYITRSDALGMIAQALADTREAACAPACAPEGPAATPSAAFASALENRGDLEPLLRSLTPADLEALIGTCLYLERAARMVWRDGRKP